MKYLGVVTFCSVLIAGALGLAGCPPSQQQPQTTKVTVLFTAQSNSATAKAQVVPPADIAQLLVSVDQVTVTPTDGTNPISILSTPQQVDLKVLLGVSALLDSATIPVGTYNAMTLVLSSATLYLASDKTTPVTDITMPDGGSFTVPVSVTVVDGQPNTVLVDLGGITLTKLDDAGAVRTAFETIQEASERAKGLTKQLLSFSRQRPLQIGTLDLQREVAQIEVLLRPLMRRDIAFSIVHEGGPAIARTDASAVQQVVMNLAINAIDAMPNGGTLELRVRGPRSEDDAWVELAVKDNGVGMDDETKARIFEPFFTTKDEGKGTGLGLAIAYGLIEQCEGNQRAFAGTWRSLQHDGPSLA